MWRENINYLRVLTEASAQHPSHTFLLIRKNQQRQRKMLGYRFYSYKQAPSEPTKTIRK